MHFLWPPYHKKHLLIAGSLALFLGFGLLGIIRHQPTVSQKTAKSMAPAQVKSATADSIRKDLREPLALSAAGNFDTAAAKSGVVILDVRSVDQFKQGHISGALSAPVALLPKFVFDPSLKPLLYSQSTDELKQAEVILGQMGIRQVYTLSDPLDTLAKKGYQITK